MKRLSQKFLILISFLFLVFPCFSFAQTSNIVPAEGLTISPPIFELNLNKGEKVSYKIQVTNPTKNLIELYPSAMDFQASGEGGQPDFVDPKDDNSKFSIGNWITFDAPKIALLPEQIVEFQFNISVPENAEPGGHYGVVFLATKPPEKNETVSQVSLSSKVGSLLLVKIPGEIRESASLEEFSTPWFYFSPPVNFTTYIRNNGNLHFKPQGEITIRNWRGKEMERIQINPVRNNVLPESHRKFESKWNPQSKYFFEQPFGRFSADLLANCGQTETVSGKIYFWIVPWWLIITLASLLSIIILLIIIKIIRKKRKKKKEKKNYYPPSAFYPNINQNNYYPSNHNNQNSFNAQDSQNKISDEYIIEKIRSKNINESLNRNTQEKNKKTNRRIV